MEWSLFTRGSLKKWLILLTVLILAGYAPFFIHGGFLGDFGDPVAQTIPNKFLLVEYFKNGILPLWNPFSFMGFPFLADMQAGTFYLPDLIIFGFFPVLYAHNIAVLLHIIFGGIGAFLLAKKITKSNFIALALALTLCLTGTFLTRIVYLNFLETIVFVPWVLHFMLKEKIAVPTLAVVISLMIFAGHPIALLYGLIIITVFAVINALGKWKDLLMAFGMGFLIASVQIIPFLYLKLQSVRDHLTYEQFIEGSLRFDQLFNLLNPLLEKRESAFDLYIYSGTVAMVLLIMSGLFYGKMAKISKKIFITGLILFVLGVLLSLGGTLPWLSRILYHLPLFSLMRVPARYIVLAHFGSFLALAAFLSIFSKQKLLGTTAALLLIINALITPSLFLQRHEIAGAQKEYLPELKTILEQIDGVKFSLTTPPHYFLSSSFFLYPNRHILSFMPNIIGYNPLTLKRFYKFLPVAAGGSFENPNYFMDYYDVFEHIGINYYIFPSEPFLKAKKLPLKPYIQNFLRQKGWEKIYPLTKAMQSSDFEIWRNPQPKPFIYFDNPKNKIEHIDFKPGEIHLRISLQENAVLTVNQIAMEGWEIRQDDGVFQYASFSDDQLVQSYNILRDTKTITLLYRPRYWYMGLLGSGVGLLALALFSLRKKKIRQK